jgi:branched-subunit amino acid ABC-type transport system permease component
MLSSFLAFEFLGWLPSVFRSIWLAIILSMLAIGVVGAFIERSLHFLGERHKVYEILLTYAYALIIYEAVHILFGSGGKFIETPSYLADSVKILGSTFPVIGFFILAVGVAAYLGLSFFLYNTRIGLLARGISFDEETARTIGINTNRVSLVVFVLGCSVTAIGGGISGMWIPVTPYMWELSLLQAFCIVIIGGIGSVGGAFIGSIVVGQLTSFSIMIEPRISMVMLFFVTAIVLLIRPRGIFGRDIL